MATITVYGTPLSTYVRTVRLLLEEANADYHLKDIGIFNGENTSAEYKSKNPFGKVPTLEIDGKVLYETGAITEYLDTVIATNQFTPSDALLKARMRQIIGIIDNYLYPAAILTIVIQRLIVPSQGGQTDEEAVKEAIAPATTACLALEDLSVGSPYLLGTQLTLADFYLIPIFIYLSKTPEFEVITSQTPKLKTWWESIKTRESVLKVDQ